MMKRFTIALAFLLVFASAVFGDGDTPIANLKLTTDANGNMKDFTNLNEIVARTTIVDTVISTSIFARTMFVGGVEFSSTNIGSVTNPVDNIYLVTNGNIFFDTDKMTVSNGTLLVNDLPITGGGGGTSVYANTAGTSLYANVAGALASTPTTTYYVATTGNDTNSGLTPADAKQTIEAAVLVASNGEAVSIADGTYQLTNLLTIAKSVTIFGSAASNVIITTSAVYTNQLVSMTADASIHRVTIRGGTANLADGFAGGGNVEMNSAGAAIYDSIIEFGKADQYGGGVFINDGGGSLYRCIIRNNEHTDSGGGGGVFASGSGNIFNCLVYNNIAQGAGGGIFVNNTPTAANMFIRNCTIVSNRTVNGFWGYYSLAGGVVLNALGSGVGSGYMQNCIVWSNAPGDMGFALTAANAARTVYNNYGSAQYHGAAPSGPGNINTNPLFVGFQNTNFTLSASSPCITAGRMYLSTYDPAYGFTNRAGSRCAQGAFEVGFDQTTMNSDLAALAVDLVGGEKDPIALPLVVTNMFNGPYVAKELGVFVPSGTGNRKPYAVAPLRSDSNYVAMVGAYTTGGGVRFLNVTTPSVITEITNVSMPSDQNVGSVVGIQNNAILTGNGSGYISVFNWSTRTNPVLASSILAKTNTIVWAVESDGENYIFACMNGVPGLRIYMATNLLSLSTNNQIYTDLPGGVLGATYNSSGYNVRPWYLSSGGTIDSSLPATFSNEVSWGAAIGTYFVQSYAYTNTLEGLEGSLAILKNNVFGLRCYGRRSGTAAQTVDLFFYLESVLAGVTNIISASPAYRMPSDNNTNAFAHDFTITNLTEVDAGATVQVSIYARANTAAAQSVRIYGGTDYQSTFNRQANALYVSDYTSNNIACYQLTGTNVIKVNAISTPNPSQMGLGKGHLFLYPYNGSANGYTMSVFSVSNPTNPVLVRKFNMLNHGGFYARPTVIGDYLYLAPWSTTKGPSGALHAYNVSNPTNPTYAFRLQSRRYPASPEFLGFAALPGRNMLAGVATIDSTLRAVYIAELPSASIMTNYVGEVDPQWALVADTITTQAMAGQVAFSWGNHATNDYITSTGTVARAITADLATASNFNMAASNILDGLYANKSSNNVFSVGTTQTVDWLALGAGTEFDTRRITGTMMMTGGGNYPNAATFTNLKLGLMDYYYGANVQTRNNIGISVENGTNFIEFTGTENFGIGTNGSAELVHVYGTDTTPDDNDNMHNSIVIDGVPGGDKEMVWSDNGERQWAASIYRNEGGRFWYLYNNQTQKDSITVSRTGRIGFNKVSNLLDYHALFSGTGLDDFVASGDYELNINAVYRVRIASAAPDTFQWQRSFNNGVTYNAYSTSITTRATAVPLEYGVSVTITGITGHVIGDTWTFVGFSQLPQASVSVAPQGYHEVLFTTNYNVAAPTYLNRTYNMNMTFGNLTDVTAFDLTTNGAVYAGRNITFNTAYFNLTLPAQAATILAQYWNGSAWITMNAITNIFSDNTLNLTQSGLMSWETSTMNWETNTPPGIVDPEYEMYWMRFVTTTAPTLAPIVATLVPHGDVRLGVKAAYLDTGFNWLVDSKGRVVHNDTVANVSGDIDPAKSTVLFDDFNSRVALTTAGNNTLGWVIGATGTGAAAAPSTFGIDTANNAVGVWSLTVGSTAVGRGALYLNEASAPTRGGATFMYRVALDSLAAVGAVTNHFQVYIGLMDVASAIGVATQMIDGMWFEYFSASNANWAVKSVSNSVTKQYSLTSIPAVSNSFSWFVIDIPNNTTRANFYMATNGATEYQFVATVPVANWGALLGRAAPVVRIQKNGLLVPKTLYIDCFKATYQEMNRGPSFKP